MAHALAAGDRSGIVQQRAEAVRRATRTAFVVVADRQGIRYSHPDPANIGRRVSTDPTEALHGKTLSEAAAEAAGKAATSGAKPLSKNGYKVRLVQTAVKRAVLRAANA